MVPLWGEIFLIIILLILFSSIVWLLSHIIYDLLIELGIIRRTRRTRVVPIGRLIRIAQLRIQTENYQRYTLELERYDKVMAELKNKVIVVNPDDSLHLGIEH
tara:strand:+ start:1383 stop:1691 length:309 start_codon:yes stop_codon:yes gene_type:complete